MKKSILFFAAFIAVAVSTMFLTSCSKDNNDEPVVSDYGYVIQAAIPDQLAALYPNLTANITYSDGTVHNVKFVNSVATDKYTSKVKGNVVATIEGDLLETAVEDDKTYDTTILYAGVCNSAGDESLFQSSKKGSQLKEKAKKFSGLAGTKHTYTFVNEESK